MSLVVAQVTDHVTQIVADTRATFDDERRPSFRTDVLKLVVIAADVALSFAGNVTAGLDAIRQAANRRHAGAHIEEVIQVLQNAVDDSSGSVEFIVAPASATEGLVRIGDTGVQRNLLATWIGDRDAFERFQASRSQVDARWAFVRAGCSRVEYAMLTLREAMKAVIDDPSIKTVGAFCVSASCDTGAFNYHRSTFVHAGRDFELRTGDALLARMAQPVEEGGYAVSVVPPLHPGTPALGLSFPGPRLGMVYLPLEHDEAQAIRDVSATDFVAAVHQAFGVDLEAPMFQG